MNIMLESLRLIIMYFSTGQAFVIIVIYLNISIRCNCYFISVIYMYNIICILLTMYTVIPQFWYRQ